MAITIVSISEASAASGASTTVTTPSGAANGDLLLFFPRAYSARGTDGTTLTSIPSGASLVTSTKYNETSGGGWTYIWCYALQLTTTPAGSYSFTSSPAGSFGGMPLSCVCIRGADATTPVAASSAGNGSPSGGSSVTAPSVTTTVANSELIFFGYGDDTALSSAPSGFTAKTAWTTDPITGGFYGIYVNSQATAGASGSVTLTTAGVDDWEAILVAISPAAGGGKSDTIPMIGGGRRHSLHYVRL